MVRTRPSQGRGRGSSPLCATMNSLPIEVRNIFDLKDYVYNSESEFFQNLHRESNLRIERIISKGHSSDENFWYDQKEFEWVILLTGNAFLEFKDPYQAIKLSPGDYLLIPPHKLHRVISTAETETIWLAVFWW